MLLGILGAGKYGKEIEDITNQTGKYEDTVFFDDASSRKLVDFERYLAEDVEFYVAFGDNELRSKWIKNVKAAGGKLATIIHPTAYISPKATIGGGVAILPKAVVNTSSVIKEGVIVNTGAIVDHDSTIGEYAHVCVGAIVKADNIIPRGMRIEAGVVIERFTYK